jgi:hypothetical protein
MGIDRPFVLAPGRTARMQVSSVGAMCGCEHNPRGTVMIRFVDLDDDENPVELVMFFDEFQRLVEHVNGAWFDAEDQRDGRS